MSEADVLLVEDNPGDVRLTREAFDEIDAESTIHVADDGTEALAFCRGRGDYADTPRPDVILLDLNLPRTDGWELLERLREDADLRTIPVVVFTSSDSRSDVREAYRRCANAYITKPVDPDEFVRTIRRFARFWLGIARLPDDD